jgi:hypothetical protein
MTMFRTITLLICFWLMSSNGMGNNKETDVSSQELHLEGGQSKEEPPQKLKEKELSTPITWTQLHRLQALHAPEGMILLRIRNLEGEEGHHERVGLRFPIREEISNSFIIDSHHYRSASAGIREHLGTFKSKLIYNLIDQQLAAEVSTGHSSRLGGALEWQKSIKPGAGISLGLSSLSQTENALSLNRGEVIDQIQSTFSAQLPKEFFFNSQMSHFHSRLVHEGGIHGSGQRLNFNLGFNLVPQRGHRMGWQFFDHSLSYENGIRQHLQIRISQAFEWFSTSNEYQNLLNRTSKSSTQSAYLTWGHPFSQHLGLQGSIYLGQDLERELSLGKIKGFQSKLFWVPTHISRFEMAFNSSSESTGVVTGTVQETLLSYHVNF